MACARAFYRKRPSRLAADTQHTTQRRKKRWRVYEGRARTRTLRLRVAQCCVRCSGNARTLRYQKGLYSKEVGRKDRSGRGGEKGKEKTRSWIWRGEAREKVQDTR